MILSKRGEVHIDGCKPEMMADFTVISKAIMEEGIMTAEELHKSIELANKSEEELEKELSQKTKSVIRQFGEELEELLKELFGEP